MGRALWEDWIVAIETFVWDELFVTGLDTVDQQHRRLVELVNELSTSLIDGESQDDAALRVVIDKLADYADYHFTEEERLMEEVGVDPRHVTHHVATHRKFVEQVATMWNSRHTMSEPTGALLEFLIAWLSFHILGEDQEMAQQIKLIRAGALPAQALEAQAAPHDRTTGALLRALHNLYHLLSEQNHDLATANQRLEERVAERTRALEVAYHSLEMLSRTDGLLNIANRMCFDERIQTEWQRARRESQEVALLMIDVDLFKRYNDTYGHLQGDACLQAVAKAVAAAMRRPADLVARYGGEEIVALLPNTDLSGACSVATIIQGNLAALNIPHAGSGVAERVTVSIGAAALRPRADNQFEQLIAAADAALYEAKGCGRNQIRFRSAEATVKA
ncbi:MAG: diguanylate cyclase [Rhodocyclaceae bacterium]|nr:diguanylate cyclase [Rhodocyclaceae bacterium]